MVGEAVGISQGKLEVSKDGKKVGTSDGKALGSKLGNVDGIPPSITLLKE